MRRACRKALRLQSEAFTGHQVYMDMRAWVEPCICSGSRQAAGPEGTLSWDHGEGMVTARETW